MRDKSAPWIFVGVRNGRAVFRCQLIALPKHHGGSGNSRRSTMSDAHSMNDIILNRATQPKEIEEASESSLADFFLAVPSFDFILCCSPSFFFSLDFRHRHCVCAPCNEKDEKMSRFFLLRKETGQEKNWKENPRRRKKKSWQTKLCPPPNSHYKLNLFHNVTSSRILISRCFLYPSHTFSGLISIKFLVLPRIFGSLFLPPLPLSPPFYLTQSIQNPNYSSKNRKFARILGASPNLHEKWVDMSAADTFFFSNMTEPRWQFGFSGLQRISLRTSHLTSHNPYDIVRLQNELYDL